MVSSVSIASVRMNKTHLERKTLVQYQLQIKREGLLPPGDDSADKIICIWGLIYYNNKAAFH